MIIINSIILIIVVLIRAKYLQIYIICATHICSLIYYFLHKRESREYTCNVRIENEKRSMDLDTLLDESGKYSSRNITQMLRHANFETSAK